MQASRPMLYRYIGVGLALVLGGPFLRADDKELPRNLQKGSSIIGEKVVNDQGQSLGEVEEIVIDPQTGQITYAVLSFGGFLGIGDKYFAIPWQSLRADAGKNRFVLSVEKERLKGAPGFDKNHWPDLNPQWANQVNEFYGVQPLVGDVAVPRFSGFEFGDKNLKREAINLPLMFETGKSYHYLMEMKPYVQGRGGFSSAQREDERTAAGQTAAMTCKHDNWLKVIQGSADEATLSFTFDATNCELCKQTAKQAGQEPPGKGTFTVKTNKKGGVESIEPEAGTTASKHLTAMEQIAKLQIRQLLGDGLHNQKLEPGKTYDAEWMHFDAWEKAKEAMMGGRTPGARPAIKNCTLRYDGYTETDGERVALFTAAPTGGEGSFSKPRAGTQTGRDDERQVGGTVMSDRASGQTNFRLSDGFLERFALVMPASVMKSGDKDDQKGPAFDGPVQLTIRRVD